MKVLTGSDFQPPWPLTNGHVQTMVSGRSLRRLWLSRKINKSLKDTKSVIVNAQHGVRLAGYFTAQMVRPQPRGLAVLFHGWEGSAHSIYMMETGSRLLAEGFDIFRLNFRDHGGSYILNQDLFHSCRIDEVVYALGDIAMRWPIKPMLLVGFSLGGNFALRVAMYNARINLALCYVLAVCPVIDPKLTLLALKKNRNCLYHNAFMYEWRYSLRMKQKVFPHYHYFDKSDLNKDMLGLTEVLALKYAGFDSLESYLNGYTLIGNALHAIKIPATILTSRDDPIIPITSFEQLDPPSNVVLDIADYGGHCGFIHNFSGDSFIADYVVSRFNAWLDDGGI